MGTLTFLYPLVLLCKAAWWKKKVLIHLLRKGITIKSQFYPILQDLGLKNGIKTTFHCLTTDCQGSQI